MAAIFDFQHAQTSDSIPTIVSPCCPTQKTWVLPLEHLYHHAYKPRYTLFPMHFRLLAAIFDFWHTRTSDCLPNSLSVLLDPENTGIAIGISLLSCIRELRYTLFNNNNNNYLTYRMKDEWEWVGRFRVLPVKPTNTAITDGGLFSDTSDEWCDGEW